MWIACDRFKIRQVPSICQLAVIDDPNAPARFKNVPDKVGTDRSRTASHGNFSWIYFPLGAGGSASFEVELVGTGFGHQIIGPEE
jgi:hypothetical protein